jgi:hypothetical protein
MSNEAETAASRRWRLKAPEACAIAEQMTDDAEHRSRHDRLADLIEARGPAVP